MSDELDKLLSAGSKADKQQQRAQAEEAAALDQQRQRELSEGTPQVRQSLSFWGFLSSGEFLAIGGILSVFGILFSFLFRFAYEPLVWWMIGATVCFLLTVGLAFLWCKAVYKKQRVWLSRLPYSVVGYWSLLDKNKVRAAHLWIYFKEPAPKETLGLAARGLGEDDMRAEMHGEQLLCFTKNPFSRDHANYQTAQWFARMERRFLRVIHQKYPIAKVALSDFGDKPPAE